MSDLYNNTVSHLKQINFALLVLTTIVVVMSLLTGKTKIETAIDDLNNLKSAFSDSQTAVPVAQFNDLWLTELASSKLNENGVTIETFYFENEQSDRANKTVQLTTHGFFINNAMGLNGPELVYPLSINIAPNRNPERSLQDIKRFWDGMYDAKQIIYVKSPLPLRFRFDEAENKLGYYEIRLLDNVDTFSTSDRLNLVDSKDEEWFERTFSRFSNFPSLEEDFRRALATPNGGHRFFLYGGENMLSPYAYDFSGNPSTIQSVLGSKIMIPVQVDQIDFFPLHELVNLVPEDFDWKVGTFNLNFSALDQLTNGFQDIPVSKLETILKNELERTSGSVNAFGLALPYEILSKFGALAIFFIQLYFLFYLRFFHSHLDNSSEQELTVPWIYLHKKLDTSIVYFLVSIAYPTSVAVFFTWENLTASSGWSFTFNVATFVCVITVFIALTKLTLENKFLKLIEKSD